MRDINISIENPTKELLTEYSKISICFEIESILNFKYKKGGLGGIVFSEEKAEVCTKNYDTKEDNPSHLMEKFDLENWLVVVARDGKSMIGGAIIAYDTEGVNMLEERKDLGVLWDIRINESYRKKGIGSLLVSKVKEVLIDKGCNRLKIETQNNNVKACKFYVSQGAYLSNMNRYIYKDCPEEIQLIWSIDLKA